MYEYEPEKCCFSSTSPSSTPLYGSRFVFSIFRIQIHNEQAITALSYNGDIRTWFAENPHKVENIVSGNYGYFQQLYRSVLEECPYVHQSASKTNEYEQVSKIIVY